MDKSRWLIALSLAPDQPHTAEDIRKAFLRTAKLHHPDSLTGASSASAERFREAAEAYENLQRVGAYNPPKDVPISQGPAMDARRRAAARHKRSEFPAWFSPPLAAEGGDPKGGKQMSTQVHAALRRALRLVKYV
jgi:hypothetical protein